MSKLFLVAILVLINGFNILFVEHCYADLNKVKYELQEKCGNKADKWFKAEFGNYPKTDKDGNWLFNYSNHYNEKLNKCFAISVSTLMPKDKNKKAYIIKILFDINENKEYGSFTGKYGEVNSSMCIVNDKLCKSEGEWDALVKPYMEQ